MAEVTVEEVGQHLLDYLQQLGVGETLVILHAGRPIAEVKPIASASAPRPFALCAGEFTVPDDFDDPLPESIIEAFEE